MPIYTSDQNLKSGLPLGGIGAGKLEILPSGAVDHFTFLNNLHRPMTSCGDAKTAASKGLPGFHFCLFIKDKNKKIVRVLQTQPVASYPAVESIKFNGVFPFAHLEYQDSSLPVECILEAFSPFIPGDDKNSGWPVAIFKFKVTNPFSRSMEVSLLGTARNLIGEGGVGRFNQVVDTPKATHVNFYNKKTQGHDTASGEMALTVLKNKNLECTYLGEWNMQGKHFFFDSSSLSLGDAWVSFAKEGILPNTNTEKVVVSESFQLGGALAAKAVLKPKQSVSMTFILSWYFPVSNEGHVYETWFRNVTEVAQSIVEKNDSLHRATREWAKELAALKIDPWLKDALANNLYPIVSGSFWNKRGRFGLFEAPEVCPLLGTLDVRFYGSLPLLLFFPQLELKEMAQFAEAQRPQGYIPHDLGFKRSDLPSNSTNGLFWKDLNSKFILLAYRDFLWTKDESFLKKIYPFIKKSFYWLVATDKNKDYLPDNEGADQTFDLWNFYGANAYTSGIFLASLLALQRIAVLLQDAEMQQEAALWFKKGRASFEKKLWHKTYFIAYNNIKEGLSEHQISHHVKAQKINIACTSGQLAGQWIAHQLGLGYIVSEEKVKRAVSTMLERNGSSSPFGAVNAVLPSGEKDKTNRQAENIWFGMTYALASLAIYEGYEKEGLALAKKAWDNAVLNILNPWNQSDMCSSSDGTYLFGDHYMRNMVIWGVLLALAKKNKEIERFLARFSTDKNL
jgi:non-lysosomal glucosylceramidase